MERYSRQIVFSEIGEERQKILLNSRVAILGLGALGTVSANNLCRSGIGNLRLIDRDYVELSNLQRQMLYDEIDAKERLPKAIAAANHLAKINSEIVIEPVIKDVNSSNIEDLIKDVDLVLDATDNWEIRFLLNEACHFLKKPWIYCAALGSEGMTMNIMAGDNNPCLKCFLPNKISNQGQSCSTFGVLNMATMAIASVQSAEALKILISNHRTQNDFDTYSQNPCQWGQLFTIDLWKNHSANVKFQKNPDCPVCALGNYEYFGKLSGSYTTNLCGTNSIQIVPATSINVDFSVLANKLSSIGNVKYNQYYLNFADNKYEIMLFKDGRAIIKNAIDANNAKSIYTEYLGL
ncbi:MAG: ThiF family adenylyltransferase [Candidatus Cloacimonetes bacterium]|nr:ThiF family adenylyltransferase [Candidatus Cloacimonadota bacterium]